MNYHITTTEDRRAEEDRVGYGDVRSGSVKRIASEVAEGSMVLQFVQVCSSKLQIFQVY